MIPLIEHLPPDFLGNLLAGMALNFSIAGIAFGIGVALGIPLALMLAASGVPAAISTLITTFLRAPPTFVIMFFLLNVIPRDAKIFGTGEAVSGVIVVALSLVPYSVSYVADSGAEAVKQLRNGSPLGALLFLPNVARSFFILVMSSSTGSAIGVAEGVTVILHQSERLSSIGERLTLFAVGILFFGVTLQVGSAAVALFHRLLIGAARRRSAITA
jgi:ABC-type amino acid transport system permease subunit